MRRGWCPSVAEPMPTGDGLLARVTPPMAMLTCDMARALAAAARDFGNGALGVTGRARIQVRGLSATSAGLFARAMAATGVAEDNRLVVSPLAGCDPAIPSDFFARATAMAASIVAVGAKYSIVVDGGGVLSLDTVRADRRLRYRDGVWCESAAPAPPISGADDSDRHASVGLIEFTGVSRVAFGIAPVFGRLDADALDGLAVMAGRFGDAVIRVTPWRSLVIGHVAAADVACLASSAAAFGFIVDPRDPRLNVAACIGNAGCASAEVDTQQAAMLLARAGQHAHVSGCTKGCAHPAPSPLTLVGRNGGFDVVVDGRAGDAPVRAGLTLAEVFE